jgi:hypothetical protein
VTTPSSDARWWRARRERMLAEPSLGAALLGGAWTGYALHRLRGFAVARLGAAVLHVLEALVVARLMAPELAAVGFVLQHATALAAAAWWGATEVLRQRLRDLDDDSHGDAAAEAWLCWAGRLAIGVLVLTLVLGARWRDQPAVAAYAALLLVRLAIDLLLRVWHARVAARGRVYRPPWIQLAIEAIGPALAILLGGALGAWQVLAILAASSLGARIVSWHYIRRATTRLGRPRARLRLRTRAAVPWGPALLHALGGAATRLPSVLGVIVLITPGLPMNVALTLHLATGMLSAATGWTWAHYHDLVPLQVAALGGFRRRVERLIAVEALVIGAACGGLALLVVALAAPRLPPLVPEPGVIFLRPPRWPAAMPYAHGLPALTMAMALLAAAQLIAWTRRRLGATIVGGAVAVLAALAAPALLRGVEVARRSRGWLAPERVVNEHVALAVALVLAGVITCALAWWPRRVPRRGRLPWQTALRAAEVEPTPVAVLGLARGGALATEVATQLERVGVRWWARRDRTLVVAGADVATLRGAVARAGGWIVSVRPWAEAAPPLRRATPPVARPGDLVFDVVSGRVDRAAEVPRPTLTRVWRALLADVRGGRDREVTLGGLRFAGDELTAFTVRVRHRDDGDGDDGLPPGPR